MYSNLYEKLKAFILAKKVRATDAPIYSFSGETVRPICIIEVLFRISEIVVNVELFVMNIDSPYNAILGRSWFGDMKAVASLFHQKLKFLSPKGVVVVRGKQENAHFCFNLAMKGPCLKSKSAPNPNRSALLTSRDQRLVRLRKVNLFRVRERGRK